MNATAALQWRSARSGLIAREAIDAVDDLDNECLDQRIERIVENLRLTVNPCRR